MEKNLNIKKEFTELAKAKIRENRNIVISKDNLGFITIAQQVVLNEDGRETEIFLKGAIEIETKYVYELQEAVNLMVAKMEEEY